MDLQNLRYFLTVARMGNISHAAMFHYVPQSAMSRSISRLEAELGVKLFDRSHNKITLNENGVEFSKSVQAVLKQLDDAIDLVKDDEKKPCGEVHLLSLQYRPLLTSYVSAFVRKHPEVSFNISHKYEDLKTFERGLCISSYEPTNVQCESQLLLREELVLAVAKEHALAKKDSVKLSELRDEYFLLLSQSNSLWRIPMAHCHKYGFEFQPGLECNDTYCLWNYIHENVGVAFISPLSWCSFPLDKLKLLKVDEPDFYRDTYLYWPKNVKLSHTTRLFAEYIIDEFRSLADA